MAWLHYLECGSVLDWIRAERSTGCERVGPAHLCERSQAKLARTVKVEVRIG